MITWTARLLGSNAVLDLVSFQSQRRLGASAWLSLVATYRPDLVALILPDNLLEIQADGAGFMTATITTADIEREPYRASITIRARVTPVSFAAATREARNVRERSSADGRRTIICDPDPLLRPNDTIQDGAVSFVAGNITYRIASGDQSMSVVEVAD